MGTLLGRTAQWAISDVAAEALILMLAIGLAIPAGVLGWVIGHESGGKTRTVTISTTPAPANTAGKAVFASAGCGGCHTLKAAEASGAVGPNLDQVHPAEALVIDRVTHGKGKMPSFAGQLSPQQIKDVAAFVAAASR